MIPVKQPMPDQAYEMQGQHTRFYGWHWGPQKEITCRGLPRDASAAVQSLPEEQNAFHRALESFVNKGYFGLLDLQGLLRPCRLHRRQAEALVRRYAALKAAERPAVEETVVQEVPPYAGHNAFVYQMMEYLARHLADDLRGAYVHGSLGSYEEVAYSDFDALVVLKDEVLESPRRLSRVGHRLCRAQAIMRSHDLLQHHGWFVLTEFDLGCYCEAYFPSVLFRYAKSLLPGQGGHVALEVRDSFNERCQSFHALSSAVLRTIESKAYPRNMYQLKSLLSRFMLLPALYVQVRDGEGVWKGDSFDLAKGDFGPELWASMETASEIRRAWRVELSAVRRWLLVRSPRWRRHLQRRLSPLLPADLVVTLDDEFYAGVSRLVRSMRAKAAALLREDAPSFG